MGALLELTEATFEQEVLKAEEAVLVDFFTQWCGPCRMLAPILEKVATDYTGKVKIVKVDAGAQPKLSAKYSITAVPTLLVFKGGQVVSSQQGALPEAALRALLDKLTA